MLTTNHNFVECWSKIGAELIEVAQLDSAHSLPSGQDGN